MNRWQLATTARNHWATWLPKQTQELEDEGELGGAIQSAATSAQKLIQELISQGYRAHEAEEVALKQYILLDPEPPAEDDWEAIELAEMEAKYQDMMRANLRVEDWEKYQCQLQAKNED